MINFVKYDHLKEMYRLNDEKEQSPYIVIENCVVSCEPGGVLACYENGLMNVDSFLSTVIKLYIEYKKKTDDQFDQNNFLELISKIINEL